MKNISKSAHLCSRRHVLPTSETFPQKNIEWLWSVQLGPLAGGQVDAGLEGQLVQNPILSGILLRIKLRRFGTIVFCIKTFAFFALHVMWFEKQVNLQFTNSVFSYHHLCLPCDPSHYSWWRFLKLDPFSQLFRRCIHWMRTRTAVEGKDDIDHHAYSPEWYMRLVEFVVVIIRHKNHPAVCVVDHLDHHAHCKEASQIEDRGAEVLSCTIALHVSVLKHSSYRSLKIHLFPPCLAGAGSLGLPGKRKQTEPTVGRRPGPLQSALWGRL